MAPLTTAARSLRPRAVAPAPVIDITPAPLPSPKPAPAPAPVSAGGSSSGASSGAGSVASSDSGGSFRAPPPVPRMSRSPPLDRRVGFRDDVVGDRSPYLDDPSFRSGPPSEPPPKTPPASSSTFFMDILIPAAVATAVFVGGPLLLPSVFRETTPTADPKDGVILLSRPDPLRWGLTSVALAAVAYALIALYRSF